jgi:flagellar biosynthesis protein FlhF
MRLKTLQASTMAEAMKMVRDELGPDAIIVSTSEGGRGGVRITAAVETPDPELDLRDPEPDGALIDRIAGALDNHCVPRPLADKIVGIACDRGASDLLQTLAGALDLMFDFKPLAHAATRQPVLIYGPPGAGKTSAMAKLAARAVVEHARVTMISTDTVRAGALQQLEIYGKRLNVPVKAAQEPEELAQLVAGLAGQFVLIDTTSVNPYVAQDMVRIRRIVDAVPAEGVLVMSAGREPLEARDMAAEFRKLSPARLLVTGLDMSRRLGGILSALEASGAAFAEISAMPDIVDGLRPVNPVMLARLLLEITNLREPSMDDDAARPRQPRQATGWK